MSRGFDPWMGKIPWRRKLPGAFHGQKSLASCSQWGCIELDTTEQLTQHKPSQNTNEIFVKIRRVDENFYLVLCKLREELMPKTESHLKLI